MDFSVKTVFALLFLVNFFVHGKAQAFSERRWYTATTEEFFNYIIKGPSVNLNLGDRNQIVDLNHPLTAYMQDWAMKFDYVLRAENPTAFKNIPKPQIAIPSIPRMFSNTTMMPLCFDIPTDVQADSNLKVDNSVKIAISYSGKLEEYNRPCKKLGISELETLIAWSNRIHPGCPINFKRNAISLNGCQNNLPYQKVGGIVFQPMSQWILMDISKFMMGFEYSEDMFLSELAHELAHFYQSHLSNSAENSTVFYKIEQRKWDKVPEYSEEMQKKWQLLPQITKNLVQNLSKGKAPAISDLQIIASALQEKIGSYTIEDEAFFLQSYYLSRLGINPQAGVNHLFEVWNYQKNRQQFFLPGEMPYDQCLKAYKADWMTAGKALFIPPANFLDYHHSFCFITFEVDKGVKALGNEYLEHKKLVSKFQWSEIQKMALDILNRELGR